MLLELPYLAYVWNCSLFNSAHPALKSGWLCLTPPPHSRLFFFLSRNPIFAHQFPCPVIQPSLSHVSLLSISSKMAKCLGGCKVFGALSRNMETQLKWKLDVLIETRIELETHRLTFNRQKLQIRADIICISYDLIFAGLLRQFSCFSVSFLYERSPWLWTSPP